MLSVKFFCVKCSMRNVVYSVVMSIDSMWFFFICFVNVVLGLSLCLMFGGLVSSVGLMLMMLFGFGIIICVRNGSIMISLIVMNVL